MGVSTNAQICYGIMLDEDAELPWDEDFDDEYDWWLIEVLGFKRSFEMFTPAGDWIGGKRWSEEKIKQYDEEMRDFEKSNPALPITLVNYCSDDYSMYIIAIPETCNSARRGYPEKINPSSLVVTDEQKCKLIKFCETHGIDFEDEPQWYLSSYWG